MNNITYKYLTKLLNHILKYSTAVEKQFTVFIYSLYGEKNLNNYINYYSPSFEKLGQNIKSMIQTILIRDQLYGKYLRFLNSCSSLMEQLVAFSSNTEKLLNLSKQLNISFTYDKIPELFHHLNTLAINLNELLAVLSYQNTKPLVDISLNTKTVINNNNKIYVTLCNLLELDKAPDVNKFLVNDIFSYLEKQILIISELATIILFIIEGTVDIDKISIKYSQTSNDLNIINDIKNKIDIDKKTEQLLVEISKIMSEIK